MHRGFQHLLRLGVKHHVQLDHVIARVDRMASPFVAIEIPGLHLGTVTEMISQTGEGPDLFESGHRALSFIVEIEPHRTPARQVPRPLTDGVGRVREEPEAGKDAV